MAALQPKLRWLLVVRSDMVVSEALQPILYLIDLILSRAGNDDGDFVS